MQVKQLEDKRVNIQSKVEENGRERVLSLMHNDTFDEIEDVEIVPVWVEVQKLSLYSRQALISVTLTTFAALVRVL